MRVVGIDPGTARIGYALLEAVGPRLHLIRAETIHIPSNRDGPAEHLSRLAAALKRRFKTDRPDAVALERLYFSKNTKTALAVAEARGVILLTAAEHVRSIWEYTPGEVKMATAGYGRADKSYVRRMTQSLLPGARLPRGDDAIDAIAIAITAAAINARLRFSR